MPWAGASRRTTDAAGRRGLPGHRSPVVPRQSSAPEGLGLHDADLLRLAVRQLEFARLALGGAADGRAERRLRGVDLQRPVGTLFTGAEQECLLIALVAVVRDGHDHAGLDGAVVGRADADLGLAQQFLDLADPVFHLGLLVAGRVIAAVLL